MSGKVRSPALRESADSVPGNRTGPARMPNVRMTGFGDKDKARFPAKPRVRSPGTRTTGRLNAPVVAEGPAK
ncbi:hypothetical protein ATP06_0219035 [Amycolatopsis regifaucium]|uniref:Uncharacterized protein n=1 Tax=Amycolatopsis regifaucium TaxID=546365 RepID=A0ABX3DQD0_9PSEU|nr:hypothetical protein ATP06_0219035 [Amycolatopsis regifaucium]